MKISLFLLVVVSAYSCGNNGTNKKAVTIYVAGCDRLFYCNKEVFSSEGLTNAPKDDSAFLLNIIKEADSLKSKVLIKPIEGSCDGIMNNVMDLKKVFERNHVDYEVNKPDALEDGFFRTITFSNPYAMAFKEEPADSTVLNIKPESTVTFLLAGNNKLYYYKGKFNGQLIETNYIELGNLITDLYKRIDQNDAMFLIKSEEHATFKNAIDILDQMTLHKIPPGHYAEVDITKEEVQQLNTTMKSKNI